MKTQTEDEWVCPKCDHYYEEPLNHPFCKEEGFLVDISPWDGLGCRFEPTRFKRETDGSD